jgi:TetR/AcrR family transcriptional regulator, ethionamide resistance regulator
MSSRPARARRDAARTRREAARDRILAAAERLLRDRPYRELSVEDVMTEAGLSRTIFYRHFDGLPELMLSLFDTITQALMTQVQGAGGPGDTRAILAAAVDAYAEHGGLLRAIDEAARHDAEIEAAYRRVVDAFTAVIAGQIEDGMAAGRIRPGNAHELARALNPMNGNYLLETLGRDPGFDRRLAVDTLMAVWGPVAGLAQ